jgi:hypothetical protein
MARSSFPVRRISSNGNDRFVNQVYYGNLSERTYNLLLLNRENAYLAGKLNWNGRDLYVQVYTFTNREGRRTSLVKKDTLGAPVDIVKSVRRIHLLLSSHLSKWRRRSIALAA